jgi:hypothetical protein
MGVSASATKIVNSAGKEVIPTPASNAQWVYNPTTGYKWVIPAIVSGPEVEKVSNPDGSQTWGPYKKTYTQSQITGLPVFTPPDTIDGIKPLCRCSQIRQYMDPGGMGKGNLAADLALVSGNPACWEDVGGLVSGRTTDSYSLTINHPFFELYSNGGQGSVGSLARLRGFSGPLPPPGQLGTLNTSGRPVLYGQQPRMPSAIMINPITGQQQVAYGPQYTTTTKIIGGKSVKKGKDNKISRTRRRNKKINCVRK